MCLVDNMSESNTLDRIFSDSFEDTVFMFHLVFDSLIKVSHPKRIRGFSSHIENEADILCQKFILHTLSINTLLNNSLFNSELTGLKFNFLDPFSIDGLLRSQFETYIAFSHVFANGSQDEIGLYYKIWKIAGLKSRNNSPTNFDEFVLKQELEKKEINDLIDQVKKHDLYLCLNEESQKQFDRLIKNKEWKFYFDGDRIKINGWAQMSIRTGMS